MAMFHLLKIRTSIDIFKNEKCKVTFGLAYISFVCQFVRFCQLRIVCVHPVTRCPEVTILEC